MKNTCKECIEINHTCLPCFLNGLVKENVIDENYIILWEHHFGYSIPCIGCTKEYYESFYNDTSTEYKIMLIPFEKKVVGHVLPDKWESLRKRAKEIIDRPDFERLMLAHKMK